MGSTSINASAGTWIATGSSGTHGSDTLLRNGVRYEHLYNRTGTNCYAILQFSIPSSLKYKRITFAQVKFYSHWYNGGSEVTQYYGPTGMEAAPYIINSGVALSSLTGANFETNGTLGEWITVEPFGYYDVKYYPRWRNVDVSSMIIQHPVVTAKIR